ncbi:hypothetical protein RhiirC2_823927, partial [Rhizophagus irregularis]
MAITSDHTMGGYDKTSKESIHKPNKEEDLKYFAGLLSLKIGGTEKEKQLVEIFNEHKLLEYHVNTLGRTTKNGNQYTYVGFFTETAREKFIKDTRITQEIGEFRPLQWLDKLDQTITLSVTGIDKHKHNITEVERTIERKFGKIKEILSRTENYGKIDMKMQIELRCTEDELMNTWGIIVNEKIIKVEPLNYKFQEIKKRGIHNAILMDIPIELEEEDLTESLYKTGARYWYRESNKNDNFRYSIRVYFKNEYEQKNAMKEKFEIQGQIFTWLFRHPFVATPTTTTTIEETREIEMDMTMKEITLAIEGIDINSAQQKSDARYGWTGYDIINNSFNEDNSKGGTVLILKNNISDRKYKMEKIDGYAIKLEILFRKQKNLTIIGIYRPNDDRLMTNRINEKITEWIQEAYKLDQDIIIMGDLNESASKATKKKQIIKNLYNHDLYDVHEVLVGKETLDTWKSGELSSRIDYIFCNEDILKEIISHEVKDINVELTDHKALTLKFKIKDKIKYNKRKYLKELGNQYKKIVLEAEDWEELAETIEDIMINQDDQDLTGENIWNNLVLNYESEYHEIIKKKENERKKDEEIEGLNKTQEKQKIILKKIAIYNKLAYLDNITFNIKKIMEKTKKQEWREYTRRTFSNKIHKLSEKQFSENLFINSWGTSDMGKNYAMKIMKMIKDFNEKKLENDVDLKIDNLRTHQGRETFKYINEEREEKMRILYEEIINENIELNIRKREIDLEEDIGTMIKKILEKSRKKIDMSSLIIKENDKYTIEKNQEEIKERVYEHYKEWTRKRQIDLDLIEYEEEWRNIYSPIETINPIIYDKLTEPITLDELDEVIKIVKNNKAPGLSGIPYDFWKHSKDLTRNLLLGIINESFEREIILDEWKKEKEKEECGYKIEVERITDINEETIEKEEITINATAFMDDTTIIGKDKKSIEKMVEICHEFFQINDIKANV